MKPFPLLKNLRRKDPMGLDWGAATLKWAKIDTIHPGRYHLTFLDRIALPESETERLLVLKEYVIKRGLQGNPVALSFQDDTFHVRRLDLPRMPPQDLMEAIRWHLRDIAEESIDDYVVRYSLLEEKIHPEMVQLSLLAYAIKRSTIQQQMALLQKVSLKPFFIEPTPVSVAATVSRVFPTEGEEWIGCADIGFKKSYFLVMGHGKLYFFRPLPGISANDLSKPDYATRLSIELQNSLDAFFITYHTEKISRLFLMGGGAKENSLPQLLSKNLGIPTEILNPFYGIEGLNPFPLAKEEPYLFSGALGAAFLKP